MQEPSITNQELIRENTRLKERIQELENSASDLEKIKKDLRISEQKYQTIFETTGTTMLIMEEDMTISLANKGFQRLTGYTREEIEGHRRWIDFIHKDDLEMMISNHKSRRADPENTPKSYEFRLIHRDGSIKNILITVDLLPGTKSSIASLIDITDRKKAEESLKESEKMYRQLFMNAPAAIYEVDYRTRRFISFNDIIPVLTGYTREELMEMDPWDIFTDESQKIFIERMKKMKDHIDISTSQEYTLRKKDGGIFWVNTNIDYTIENNFPVKARIVAHNITDRKQAEEALRESEIKFKSFAEQALVGTYIIQDGTFRYVNPKFAQMFGYTVGECLAGMYYENLVSPEDLGTVREQIKKRMEHEVETVHYNFRGVKKSGEIFHAEVYGSSSIFKGRPAAAGTILDITERTRAEEEREKLIAELQKALSDVKILSGLLPICASCKKIRDDSGYWNQLELFIQSHSKAEFSHGICPDCAKKLYPELFKDK